MLRDTRIAIREHDMFGHVINLNFDRRGDSHKTLCGGVFSIFFKCFLTFYVYLMFTKLIFKTNDTNYTYEGQWHLEGMEAIKYSDMSMRFFHVIKKQSMGNTGLKYSDIDGYFTMSIV